MHCNSQPKADPNRGLIICGTLFRKGAGRCSARYLNAPKVEDFVVEKIKECILTEETIVELVKLVVVEIDAMAGELPAGWRS